MALEFYKRRFRKPGKKMQYFLAFTALLLAILAVTTWMYVRHRLSLIGSEDGEDDLSSTVSAEQYTAEDKAGLLVVFTGDEQMRFVLITTDPANAAVTVTAIPDDTATGNDTTLSALYQKHGGARAVSAVATLSKQPVKHYLSISADNAEKWFNRLENGLTVTLSSPLSYPAADGSPTTLSAGEHTLNAVQITALLSYAETPEQACAELLAAMLQQYLRTGRNLTSDFSFLANATQTNLRIGDFTAYRDALSYLATKNDEGVCTVTASVI